MAKAKASIEELVEFKNLLSTQKESSIVLIDGFCDTLSQWQAQIYEEKQRCAILHQRCQEKCDEEEQIVEEFAIQISRAEAQLAGMDPYIEVQHVDDEGEIYTTLEENPAYTALEREIRALRMESAVHERRLSRLKSVLYKIEGATQRLNGASQELNEISESLKSCESDIEEYSEKAETLLGSAIQSLEGYLAVSIGGAGGSGSGVGSYWEKFAEGQQGSKIVVYQGRSYVEMDGYYFGEEAMARIQPSGSHYGTAIYYGGWAGRSILPQFVIHTINYSLSNGLTERQENGRNRHYCGSISVITTLDNRHIITVFDNPDQNK